MLGVSSMIGIISAQSNIELARQNQGLANQRYLSGRIRERQGLTDGNQDAIEEGQRLQAEGQEMEMGTFEHLGNAMYNINNANVDNQSEYDESEDSYDGGGQETPAAIYERTNDESYVAVRGDTIRGSANRTVSAPRHSAPRQSSVDITV